MNSQKYLMAFGAVAALALAMPAGATQTFSALESVDAQALDAAEMQATTGQNSLAIAAALRAAATKAQNPTAASTFSALAAAYSRITVPTSRIIINRVLIKR